MRNPLPDWTVWGAHGLDSVPEDYKGIYRWVLPLTDLFFIWFGVVGWLIGVESVEDATSTGWQTWWSFTIAVAALFALVGVAVPKLWPVELIGKIPLVGLVCVYVAVLLMGGVEDPLAMATAGLICILILVPIWRVFSLSRRWRRSRIEQAES